MDTDYFQSLALENNAEMNMEVQIYLKDSDLISFGCIQETGLLDYMEILFLVS